MFNVNFTNKLRESRYKTNGSGQQKYMNKLQIDNGRKKFIILRD